MLKIKLSTRKKQKNEKWNEKFGRFPYKKETKIRRIIEWTRNWIFLFHEQREKQQKRAQRNSIYLKNFIDYKKRSSSRIYIRSFVGPTNINARLIFKGLCVGFGTWIIFMKSTIWDECERVKKFLNHGQKVWHNWWIVPQKKRKTLYEKEIVQLKNWENPFVQLSKYNAMTISF